MTDLQERANAILALRIVGLDTKAVIRDQMAEIARLQRIIDSRPAINAGLPGTYIEWSHSVYEIEAARALGIANG